MRVAIASDHAGFIQKAPIAEYIESLGHEVIDFGPENDDRVDYPDYADKVARYVAAGGADRAMGTARGAGLSRIGRRSGAGATTTSLASFVRKREPMDGAGPARKSMDPRVRGDDGCWVCSAKPRANLPTVVPAKAGTQGLCGACTEVPGSPRSRG